MEGNMCPDCNVTLQKSDEFDNGMVCPKCNIIELSYSGGGLGEILEAIDCLTVPSETL